MNNFKNNFICICIFILVSFSNCAFAEYQYKIEKVLHNGNYVINGLHWKAHSECGTWKKGDKVVFLNKQPHSKCVVTNVRHTNSNTTCKLWCSDNMHDGI